MRTPAPAASVTEDPPTSSDLPRRRHDPRRERTRARLLDAARVVFERDGFYASRLADVALEAGVSTGTFYNYYRSKEELFRDVMSGVVQDLVEREEGGAHHDDPVEGIHHANRAYVRGYRRHARLMNLLLQMAERDDELRERRLEIRQQFEDRISRAIASWQRAGLAYADLDPVYAANALAYMVDRFLYEWTVLDLEYDEDVVVETLSKLWARSLGLERPERTTVPV